MSATRAAMVLGIVSRNPGASPSEVARTLGIIDPTADGEIQSVSRILRRLEGDGLVSYHGQDRHGQRYGRRGGYRPTSEGVEAVERLERAVGHPRQS